MAYIHPAILLINMFLTLYVLGLGYTRFANNHLGAKITFNWNRHVVLGQIALLVILAGVGSGLFFTWFLFGGPFMKSLHWTLAAYVLAPLAIIQYALGLTLHMKKKKRTALPLLHALLGVAIVLVYILQAVVGAKILMH